MTFSKRQISLLDALRTEIDYRPTEYFAKKCSVSNKTIFNDIQNMQEALSEHGIAITKIARKGIKLDGDINQLNKLIKQFTLSESYDSWNSYTPIDRQIEIFKMLFIESERITYQELSEAFMVSKTSIANDLETIASFLNDTKVCLVSSNIGTQVEGEEAEIQKVIKNYANYLLKENHLTQEDFLTKIPYVFERLFPLNIFNSVYTIMKEHIVQANPQITSYYLQSLIISIIILMVRISKGHHIQEKDYFLFDTIEPMETYVIALVIQNELRANTKIELSKNDFDYLNRQLYVHGVEQKIEPDHLTDTFLNGVNELIMEVGSVMDVDLSQDDKLKTSLISHLLPMIYRLKMGTNVQNPLLEEIRTHYSVLFSACMFALNKLEATYDLKITYDEIAFCTVHFQVAIDKLGQSKKIVVVCPTGFGTSELIVNRIRRFIPAKDTIEAVPLRKLTELDLSKIDLLISTIKLDDIKQNVLYVSPLITNEDAQRISSYYSKELITKNIEEVPLEFQYMSDLVDSELIFTMQNYKTKEECLECLIDALLKKDYVNEGFRKSIFERESLGNTALATGTAIPHAFPDTVKISKVAIMTLSQSIKWSKGNINAILLICITKEDLKKAKGVLSEVYSIVQSKKKIHECLLSKNSKDIFSLLGGSKNDK